MLTKMLIKLEKYIKPAANNIKLRMPVCVNPRSYVVVQ